MRLSQVAQRVAVFGEDDQLLARRRRGRFDRSGAIGRRRLRQPVGNRRRREDLAKQAGQLAPLPVLAAPPDGQRQRLQASRACRSPPSARRSCAPRWPGRESPPRRPRLRCPAHPPDPRRLLRRAPAARARDGRRDLGPPLQQLQLAKLLLQTLPSAAQRLVDGLRRRRQAALQDGQREADRARPLVVLQRLGPVELLPHVVRDFLVEPRLGVGELVGHRVGDALREQRRARRT